MLFDRITRTFGHSLINVFENEVAIENLEIYKSPDIDHILAEMIQPEI